MVLVGIFVLEEEVEKVVGIVEAGLPELARLLAYLVRAENTDTLAAELSVIERPLTVRATSPSIVRLSTPAAMAALTSVSVTVMVSEIALPYL